jgi:ABC-type branched-subunit amino acid transport system substrate-binding protein
VANRRGLAGVLLVVAIVAAACSRGGDDSSSTNNTSGGATTTAAAASTVGTFGDLKNVCGPKPAGATLTASDTGVTATSIQLSTVSDVGFSGRPGLNQELWDAATAFSKWCNAQGGINGRKITLKLRDAKLTQFQQVVIAACEEKDFMMVGGGATFDDQGQSTRLGCGLPTIAGYVVTPQATEADLTYQPVPNPVGSVATGAYNWLAQKYPDAIKKTMIVTGAIPTTEFVAARYKETLQSLGWNIINTIEYNPAGEATWRPFAEQLKTSGTKALVWVGEPSFLGNFMKAISDIGYKLDFTSTDANHYDPSLIASGGSAVNGVYIRSVFHPFLTDAQAKDDPATVQYRQIVKQYVGPKGKIAYLGVQGTSGWLLFAKAATECGADLTRDCVWANIAKIKDWTGGGLSAPQDVADNTPPVCFDLVTVQNAQFTLADINPNNGIYSCDPKNLYKIKNPARFGTGAKCPNSAYATDPKPSNCARK